MKYVIELGQTRFVVPSKNPYEALRDWARRLKNVIDNVRDEQMSDFCQFYEFRVYEEFQPPVEQRQVLPKD